MEQQHGFVTISRPINKSQHWHPTAASLTLTFDSIQCVSPPGLNKCRACSPEHRRTTFELHTLSVMAAIWIWSISSTQLFFFALFLRLWVNNDKGKQIILVAMTRCLMCLVFLLSDGWVYCYLWPFAMKMYFTQSKPMWWLYLLFVICINVWFGHYCNGPWTEPVTIQNKISQSL